jgi:hypothetical protein
MCEFNSVVTIILLLAVSKSLRAFILDNSRTSAKTINSPLDFSQGIFAFFLCQLRFCCDKRCRQRKKELRGANSSSEIPA